MHLKDRVNKFGEALWAFHDCPEMLKSSPMSAEARKISDDFFSQQEELVKIGLGLESKGSGRKLSTLGAAIYRWAVWEKTADDHTASLLLADDIFTEDSALIMERLGVAQDWMFEVAEHAST
jgi:hypothetical protein